MILVDNLRKSFFALSFLILFTSCSNKIQLNNLNGYTFGTYYDIKFFSESKNFDESDLEDLSLTLEDLYLQAKYLIGSMSGGSHLPSLFYNIPTLYIGEGTPPATLGSFYLFPKNLPKKDHFFLLSDDELTKFFSTRNK